MTFSQDSDLQKDDVLALEDIESYEKPTQTVEYSPEELKKVVR